MLQAKVEYYEILKELKRQMPEIRRKYESLIHLMTHLHVFVQRRTKKKCHDVERFGSTKDK